MVLTLCPIGFLAKLNSAPICKYQLSLMTSTEVMAYAQASLETRKCIPIIIPIGATEQHGPSGLCGTDELTASAVAREIASFEDVLLAPSISIGMSIHHTSFPGSIALRPSTYCNVLTDVMLSLRQSSNITHFFFVNGHGGNIGPAQLAKAICIESAATAPLLYPFNLSTPASSSLPFEVDVVSWYSSKPSHALARELFGSALGQHATPDEVAMTMFTHPEAFPPFLDKYKEADLENNGESIGENKATAVDAEMDARPAPNREEEEVDSVEVGDDNILGSLGLNMDRIALRKLDPKVLKVAPGLGGFTRRSLDQSQKGSTAATSTLPKANANANANAPTICDTQINRAMSFMDPSDFRRRFPDGRMFSDPALATEELGKLIFDTSVTSLRGRFKTFIAVKRPMYAPWARMPNRKD
jgi:creatinine amidohydrolase